jgi:hypothetical protein
MTEIMGRIGPDGTVEMADDRSVRVEGVDPLTPSDAAFLGRELLSCAAALSGTNPPVAGTSIPDAHFPIIAWATGPHPNTGAPTLIVKIPPGIELTFQLTMQGAKEMGGGLVVLGQGLTPSGGSRGMIH